MGFSRQIPKPSQMKRQPLEGGNFPSCLWPCQSVLEAACDQTHQPDAFRVRGQSGAERGQRWGSRVR